MKKYLGLIVVVFLILLTFTLVSCTNGESVSIDDNQEDESPSVSSTYTITWKNWDGTVLEIDSNVSAGSMPNYDSNQPTKTSTAQYNYSFSGWLPAITNVTGNATYIANFSSVLRKYTVNWVNWDGTSLEVDENVPYGTTPHYDGLIPTKPDDNSNTYTFSVWSPAINPVTENVTYTALFSSQQKSSVISFNLNDGTTDSSTNPIQITSLNSSYFFFDVHKDLYSFRGWSYKGTKVFDQNGELINNIPLEPNMTFDAIFVYGVTLTINYSLYDPRTGERISTYSVLDSTIGTGSSTQNCAYNTNVSLNMNLNEGYEFIGWFYNEYPLSTEASYNYKMWDTDIVLEAAFQYKVYQVGVYINNSDLGQVLIRRPGTNVYKESDEEDKYYTESVTIAAVTTDNISFLGWYDEDNHLVTPNAVYTFTMPNRDYYLEAKWDYFKIEYRLNGGLNNPNNPSWYEIEDGIITLYNPTSQSGGTFNGWYLYGEKITTIDSSWVSHITLNASWSYYSLTTLVNNSSAGTVSEFDAENITAGTDLTITATTKKGYTFIGWFNGDDLLSLELSYSFKMPRNNLVYTAKWCHIIVGINIPEAGSATNLNNTYKVGDIVTIKATTTNTGYTFIGWFEGDNLLSPELSYTFEMPNIDATYCAKWRANTYTVTIDNQVNGVTITGAGQHEYNSQVTLIASGMEDNTTIAWVINDIAYCVGTHYEFTMGFDVTIKTVLRPFGGDNNAIYFGSYPQSLVDDPDTLIALNDYISPVPDSENDYEWIKYGYYKNFNPTSILMWYRDVEVSGEKYRGVFFREYRPYKQLGFYGDGSGISNMDDNGFSIGTFYWFKFEPIKWNILDIENGNALLIADLIIDSQEYYYFSNDATSHSHNGGTGYSNNYELSNIRKWLNDTFYETAFTSAQKDSILTTIVDNGRISMGDAWSDLLTSQNTNDKVFLLSHREVINYYSNAELRVSNGTDYARAQGLKNNSWWLRSPYGSDASYAVYSQLVSNYGVLDHNYVSYTDIGVRPVIWISIGSENISLYNTITWKNWDGTILETDTNVVYGTIPSYDGNTPSRVDDAQYAYKFIGWSPEIEYASGDTEYIAQYTILYVYLGLYPQTLVEDTDIISSLNAEAGELPTESNNYSWVDYGYYDGGNISSYMWYQDITYLGDKYRGVYNTKKRPFKTDYDAEINNNPEVYWFKWEPIKWIVLYNNNGEAFILSNLIIDSQEYYNSDSSQYHTHNDGDGYSNSYELSDIRLWLNDNFYNSAFSSSEKEIIKTTEVYNESTNVDNNTYDKIFLLADYEIEDFTNTYIGEQRISKAGVSDYSKKQGLGHYGDGADWILRTPVVDSNRNRVLYVSYEGNLSSPFAVHVNQSNVGIRPAMWITL